MSRRRRERAAVQSAKRPDWDDPSDLCDFCETPARCETDYCRLEAQGDEMEDTTC